MSSGMSHPARAFLLPMNAPPPFVQFLEAGSRQGRIRSRRRVVRVCCRCCIRCWSRMKPAWSLPWMALRDLTVTEAGQFGLHPGPGPTAGEEHARKVEALQSPASQAVEVVARIPPHGGY